MEVCNTRILDFILQDYDGYAGASIRWDELSWVCRCLYKGLLRLDMSIFIINISTFNNAKGPFSLGQSSSSLQYLSNSSPSFSDSKNFSIIKP